MKLIIMKREIQWVQWFNGSMVQWFNVMSHTKKG